jgi:hypothetical protein
MDEALEALLRRVASGDLTPEDAEPLIAALSSRDHIGDRPGDLDPGSARTEPASTRPSTAGDTPKVGRAVRVQVIERGRTVVNLRIPMSWTGLASLVPGLTSAQVERVEEALRNGEHGRILDVQDADGDGVVISTE